MVVLHRSNVRTFPVLAQRNAKAMRIFSQLTTENKVRLFSWRGEVLRVTLCL